MRGHLRLTPREKSDIRALAAAGKTQKEIAEAIGRYPGTVVNFARRNGLRLIRGHNRFPPWTHEELNFLRRATADGWSVGAVVQRLPRRSKAAVWLAAKKIGVCFSPTKSPCQVHFRMTPQVYNKLRLASGKMDMKLNALARMIVTSALRDRDLLAMICEPNAAIGDDDV